MRRKMFFDAGPEIFALAKALRNRQTDAEMRLSGYLRTKPLGFKFRRQHPLGIYIADFYCHSAKLVIEADGKIHNKAEVQLADRERRPLLNAMKFKFFDLPTTRLHSIWRNAFQQSMKFLHQKLNQLPL